MARKLALIIGNSQYEDTGLAKLAAPDVDVRALAEVLQTPGIGAFDEVTPLLNEGLATVRKSIARFFDTKHRDDLLLLYFSGHGVRDEQGHLYLAVRDTERAVLAGTAIEASYVTTRMDRSASKRLVLVLDCCHSGAFGVGAKSAQGSTVGTASAFEGTGRGRVVLTATDSTQYAWEGDQVIGDVENSLFTHYLIEGLRSGAADRDEDGQITIDELYDYVYDHVLNETPKQTPGKWAFGQQGEIVIAQNPGVTVAKLPPEIEEALKSTLPSVRFQVLTELFATVRGRHEGRSRAAREALQRLAEDDSRKVAAGASLYLQALDKGEALSEDEWVRRVREKEEELSGRKTVGAQIESYVTAAEASLERGALDEARELLGRAQKLDAQEPSVQRLRESYDAAVEERARLEEAERRIRELRKGIAGLIARANATSSHAEAIALLNEALGLDPEHAEIRQLLETRHRLVAETEAAERARLDQLAAAAALAQAETERRAQIEAQLSDASRHLARENLTKAIVITEAVLRADPQNAAARTLHAKAQEAIEAKRLADEDAAEKRERQRKIEDMIATAEAAATPDTAVDILEDVLATDPGNVKAGRLLRKRQADAAAARAEQRRLETEEIRRIRRDEDAREKGASAPGFSVHPTVMSQAWTWLRGAALYSNTFRIASVMLFAGALTWSVVGNLNQPAVSDRSAAPASPAPLQPEAASRESVAPPPVATAPANTEGRSGGTPETLKNTETGRDKGAGASAGSRIGAGRSAANPPDGGGRSSARGAMPAKPPDSSATAETKGTTAPAPANTTPPPAVTPSVGEHEKPKSEATPTAGREPAAEPPSGTTKPAVPENKVSPPPSAPPPSLVPDEASLRQAISEYETAMSSGNRDAVKAVFRGVSESELRDIDNVKLNFGRHQYRMTVIIRKHQINGTRARVDALVSHTAIDDRGKPLPPMSRNETLNFEWTGRTWVRVR